jgi:hypothetical protein
MVINMAYFAQLDENNVVLQVIAVVNDVIKDESGIEQESLGISFCKELYGQDTNWVQTSYNNSIRGVFASIDYTYDASLDRFIPPKTYPSWVLDANYIWEPPIPYPTDGKKYEWDEATVSYVEIVQPVTQGTQEF